MTDAQLALALAAATRTELDLRRLLRQPSCRAEEAHGQMAHRGAVALRKALEDWIAARAFPPVSQ